MLIDWLSPNRAPSVLADITASWRVGVAMAKMQSVRPTQLIKVAIEDTVPVGLLAWECYPQGRLITCCVVRDERQRQGIGSNLLDVMKRHMAESEHIREIVVNVPEENLTAQQFFRANGFRWVETIKHSAGDLYLMRIAKQASECCDLLEATVCVESRVSTAM